MTIYSKTLFLDQFTPVSIYAKIRKLFSDEITFLFESTINSSDGNYSYIIVGARERIWHKDGVSYFKNEQGDVSTIDNNPLNYLREYYATFD